jgi:hypothetical protein
MKTPDLPEGMPSAPDKRNSISFSTDNPRHQRAIGLLWQRPAKREECDRAAGCSNFPDLVAELRRRGLEVPCVRVPAFDRDGQDVRIGVYSLTAADRRKINLWLSTRQGAN